MMQTCPACGHENRETAKFCEACAVALQRVCAGCGCALRPTAKFCDECGQSATGSAAHPSPASYTPKHLAEKILSSRAALEGERKQVTVLFADVKGSMELAEQVDPEEWHKILDRFFQILADGVHRFEGTVNQYTGDGIMALFGAPIAHEDHTQRACYAALHLSDALRAYARELRRERGLDFSARMGIHSGEVVVGKIGDDLRMDYTAQGHTVGLAARMEALAEPGKVYLTGDTADLVRGYFELEDLGEFKVKGVTEAVRGFELKGVGALRTRFDVSRARGLSRFVGRDADMQVLEGALESARRGKGRAVGIVGDAGVGKSRLCFELAERCHARGVNVIVGHAVPHGKNLPLLPVLEIFRTYFGIEERDEPRTAREKIAGRLLLIDEQFREVLPLVFDFLGVPDPERPAPRMDPEARQRRLVAVVRRLVERDNPNGFVILIEDLHWADAASDAFFGEWVDAIAGGPGLLLLNFRPEYRADWMKKPWYQQLPLDSLSPEAIRELLGDLLGSHASLEGLADRIHARTRGNPYFTEEIVRALVESGALEGKRSGYRLTRPIDTLEVPETVQSVLAARIDRLPEREKQVLQTAAVIGKEFAEPVLAAVANLTERDLAAALAALCDAGFLHEESLYPVAAYAFAHPLTQEVALGSQLQDRRRRRHASVARAIENLHAQRLDEKAALLAHHFEEAAEPLEAARWHARAAAWLGTRDIDETLRHWQRVRELVRALPETDETSELHLLACARTLSTGGFRLGLSPETVEELYEEGRALAERSGNAQMLLSLRGAYGAWLFSLGRVREALEQTAETVRLADAVGLAETRASARVGAAYCRWAASRFAEALAIAREGEAITGGDLALGVATAGFSALVFFVGFGASLHCLMGRLDEARVGLERAHRLARESGVPENLGWVRGTLSVLAEVSGELRFEGLGDATAAALDALRIAEEIGSPFSRVVSYRSLGAVQLVAGECAAAERSFAAALQLMRERSTGLETEALNLGQLSRALLGTGDAEGARRTAQECVALARDRGQPGMEIWGQIALAGALGASAGPESAAAVAGALARAEEIVLEIGFRAAAPWIVETRAEIARVRGDEATCQRELQEAHRLFVEIGAVGHAERLRTRLAE